MEEETKRIEKKNDVIESNGIIVGSLRLNESTGTKEIIEALNNIGYELMYDPLQHSFRGFGGFGEGFKKSIPVGIRYILVKR